MNEHDPPVSPESKPEQSQDSLSETIGRANRVIEESRAQIARSRTLSQSEAELSHEFNKLSKEHDRLTGSQKGGA